MPHAEKGSLAAQTISGGTITINNINGTVLSAEDVLQREQHYLTRVMKDCAGLEWLSLMDLRDENSQRLKLDAVYTALLTTTTDFPYRNAIEKNLGTNEVEIFVSEPESKLSALEIVNREQCLVLTGDPGSGKSAFVNYLTLCLAGENLGSGQVNLQTLTAPLPDDEGNPQTEEIKVEGKDEPEQREIRQAWEYGGLIPLRIILRDFSSSTCFPAEQDKADVCHLMAFLHQQLKHTDCLDYTDILQQRLRAGKVLVMFDGLDEVPQAGDRRKRLVACIEGFAKTYAGCRVLVTCRPYAYRDPQWHIRGFAVSHLAPFTDGQIIRFIQYWYASLGTLDQDAATARGAKLQAAVLRRSSLHDLAKRPLLLSLIAYLHAYRHELPERRADLYERLLELLVNKWEKARFDAKDCDDARRLAQHSLAEFLQIGQDVIRRVLERLAFRAHTLQDAQQQETADISSDDLILALAKAARKGGKNVDEWEVCEYLRDRVGILYQRGGTNEEDAVYTFPHRSFQEYLAAAYFQLETDELFSEHEDCQSWQEVAAQLGTSDPDRWREVVLLAGGIDAQAKPRPVWDLVDALYPEVRDCLTKSAAWGLRLAAEIMADNLNVTQVGRIHKPIFERIRAALPQVLGTPLLPAVERAAIGRYLAIIGDPRDEIMDVDHMLFCDIPAGKFWMGKGAHDKDGEDFLLKETPAGEYDLNYAFKIAKYPVTVAQFKQFVDATGFTLGDEDALRGAANTPVVWVSQAEAQQFCQWLTQHWHQSGDLSPDQCVTLPDEAEWEKAARGGLENNPEPQRRYPWGNDVSDEHLNYAMKIGQVTTPGVFPLGASPYDCEDMSGNVWEWTRSERGEYPYPAVGTKEWRERSSANGERAVCVLRGGAFNDFDYYVRSAVRLDFSRDRRYLGVGFRCCVVPITLAFETSGR
ncbi:SUMF1/EgtB/PvdO family nonheme iron enzyme [Thiothrix sp.]|jgi:formylglycine-generating enzyme required for sulfatase activity/energy-coupling factor transporter ATP-binding protein EcfA2|uniref:SUMF1/EgtB/PvdO family nonheme iron enzyme n=1 Tax=Thiothrix sp. TaxID=1032 RepID=UPI00257B3C0B|nr:SUMF1/EgtB/PvdO family nonheme iron enzyme [Thiothrix sp.]